ncbi:hypothetical protein EEB14_43005 [Rhodococcus sp. WS4]|nr:hypothetical protein EEB14_43005 [Rhodococcus sp. WS4]
MAGFDKSGQQGRSQIGQATIGQAPRKLSYCRIILHSLGKSTDITALNASAQIDWVFEGVVQFKNKKSKIGVATTPPTTNQGTTTLRN